MQEVYERAEKLVAHPLNPESHQKFRLEKLGAALAEGVREVKIVEAAGCLMILILQDARVMIERLEKQLDDLEEVLNSPEP